MLVVWAVVLVVCVVGTSFASRQAVTSALRITEASRLSPAFVGLTVMSIGTDLPEIANSLISSATNHGDVNVGDSMGSVLTQVTLVLGLLCIFGGKISAERNFIISVGLAGFSASVLVFVLVQDNELSHLDGIILILLWLGMTILLGNSEMKPSESLTDGTGALGADILKSLVWLGLVGAFAYGVVESFLQLAESFGIPEFVGSFVALSLGTSLPELAVDWTAIRRGASSMAVGDIFGSSFVDATLSIGAGPAVFGSMVSDDVRVGVAVAAVGVLLATAFTARARSFTWKLGLPLLGIYASGQLVVGFIRV